MKHRFFKQLPGLRCCAVLCPFECEPCLQIRTSAVLKFLDALEESFAGWDPQDFDAGTSHSPPGYQRTDCMPGTPWARSQEGPNGLTAPVLLQQRARMPTEGGTGSKAPRRGALLWAPPLATQPTSRTSLSPPCSRSLMAVRQVRTLLCLHYQGNS